MLRRRVDRYVEEQTLRAFQTLPKRVKRAIGSRSDCNVAWGTDRVTVAVRGEPVAEINRFVVSVRGNRLWAGDVLGDPAALRAIRAGLADFAASSPAVGDGPTARSDSPRNESARPFETQGEPAPIDERGDRDAVPPRVAWPGGVVALFEAAGMSAQVVAGGIWLEGGQVPKPTAATLADEERLRAWLDGRIEAHAGQTLYRRVTSHLADSSMLEACRRTDRVDIVAPDESVVLHITAAMASWLDGQSVNGNFLADGEWWAPVHQQISESAAEWSSSGLARRGFHREFPLNAAPELRANAVEASRRLREARARAFEHTIRIDIEDAELEFLPVVLVGNQAFVPFRLDDNETLFTGAIGLAQSDTIAPCRWDQWSETGTLAAAWALGLTVYADLTCAQDPERESFPLRAPNRGSTGRTAGGAGRSNGRRAPLRLGSDHSRIPVRFAPCEATARYLAACVAGHVRRLQAGHEHSSQAVANAARYGIRCAVGMTGFSRTPEAYPQTRSCASRGKHRPGFSRTCDADSPRPSAVSRQPH